MHQQPYLINFNVHRHTEILALGMAGYSKNANVSRNSSWKPQHKVLYYRPMLEKERWEGISSLKSHMQRYNMYQLTAVNLQKHLKERLNSP